MAGTDIKNTHSEYQKHLKRWQLIKDCLDGEDKIKEKKETYLPYPVALDSAARAEPDFADKYKVYLEGAHYTNFTEQAVEDLVSGCFRRDVLVNPELESADLGHIMIDDLAKDTVRTLSSYGRGFLLTDYPVADGTTESKQDEIDNSIGAYITIYDSLDILDWATERVGRENILTRVVLHEIEYDECSKEVDVYRELLIVDKQYQVIVHRDNGEGMLAEEPIIPKIDGKPLTRIPGTFVGSVANTARVDPAPVEGIARSNVKHYQTWGELIHTQTFVGHPQTVITGAPRGWNKQMKEDGFKLTVGANEMLVLEGEKTAASILQIAGGNLMHYKTLDELKVSMLEQGARIKSLTTTGGVESAAALRIKHGGDSSQLASIATNTERALEIVLNWASQFQGKPTEFKVNINKEFFDHAPDATLMSALGTNPKIPASVLYAYLRDVGLVDDSQTDVDIESALDEDDIGGDTNAFTQSDKDTERDGDDATSTKPT